MHRKIVRSFNFNWKSSDEEYWSDFCDERPPFGHKSPNAKSNSLNLLFAPENINNAPTHTIRSSWRNKFPKLMPSNIECEPMKMIIAVRIACHDGGRDCVSFRSDFLRLLPCDCIWFCWLNTFGLCIAEERTERRKTIRKFVSAKRRESTKATFGIFDPIEFLEIVQPFAVAVVIGCFAS